MLEDKELMSIFFSRNKLPLVEFTLKEVLSQ